MDAWGAAQSRTITWHDPLPAAAAALQLSGREALEAVRDGTISPPPIAVLLGMDLVGLGDGEATFSITPDTSGYNPIGVVHGGIICTILDSVCGCALHTTLAAGVGYTSLDINVSYLRAVRADGTTLTAHGRVVKDGRRVAFTEGELKDEQDRVVARATSTLLVIAPPA